MSVRKSSGIKVPQQYFPSLYLLNTREQPPPASCYYEEVGISFEVALMWAHEQ